MGKQLQPLQPWMVSDPGPGFAVSALQSAIMKAEQREDTLRQRLQACRDHADLMETELQGLQHYTGALRKELALLEARTQDDAGGVSGLFLPS